VEQSVRICANSNITYRQSSPSQCLSQQPFFLSVFCFSVFVAFLVSITRQLLSIVIFFILTTVLFSFTQLSSWIIIQLFHGRLIIVFGNVYSRKKHNRRINDTNTIKTTLQSRQNT